MRFPYLIPLAIGAGLLSPRPETFTAPAAPCSCRADLDSLAARIERNYVAWPIEYLGTPRVNRFRALVDELRGRADGAEDADCIGLLRELTGWFHDGHLFVFELPTVSPDSAALLAAAAETRPVSEAALRARLQRLGGAADPIEGIWYARGYRMAVVPDGAPDRFVGVVLRADSALWQPGQVKARFERQAVGLYRTVFFADDHSRRHLDARIFRNLLLQTTPVTWGREFPLAPGEAGTLDPDDPARPTLRLVQDDAVVVSVPSHDPSYRAVLQELVIRHRSALDGRPLLVVDIRGDLGGGSQTTDALLPWLVSREMRPAIGPSGLSMVVSSPDNIRYFQRGWNPDSVRERMSAAPGQLMPLMRDEQLGMPFPNDIVAANPVRVGLLMDRGVASAGEAFVLQARRSTKVTLFGERTSGMIDYQSVNVVRLACRDRGILFGYPMIAASATLPKDGINATGIVPDVPIDPNHPAALGTVLDRLRRAR